MTRAADASGGVSPVLARREVVGVAVTIVVLSRLVDGPAVALVALLAAAFVGYATVRLLGLRAAHVRPEVAAIPAVAAFACVAAVQLVPVGLALVPAVVAGGLLLDATIALEARVAARATVASASDRSVLLAASLLAAFLGFCGVAAVVPDGLVEPLASGGIRTPMPLGALVALALADATIAFALGYRFAALRSPRPRQAAAAATTYAAAIAIAAGLFSAATLPRLLGPALLTLVFFLWESLIGAEEPTRRDPRFVWEVALLAILGVVVVGWNLLLPH